ncbi:MAG: redoxin family protein [Alphaproteobacteria bacterium]
MIALRIGIIIFGTASILLIGSLLWFGLSPQRAPASFPTSTTITPDFSAFDQASPLPGYEDRADLATLRQSMRGPFVVNFFASWCQPCRLEHGYLNTFAAQNPGVLIGLAYRDDPINAAQYLTTDGNPYAGVASDTDSLNALNFGLTGVPETYIFDAEGRLLFRSPGPLVGALRDQFEDAWREASRP